MNWTHKPGVSSSIESARNGEFKWIWTEFKCVFRNVLRPNATNTDNSSVWSKWTHVWTFDLISSKTEIYSCIPCSILCLFDHRHKNAISLTVKYCRNGHWKMLLPIWLNCIFDRYSIFYRWNKSFWFNASNNEANRAYFLILWYNRTEKTSSHFSLLPKSGIIPPLETISVTSDNRKQLLLFESK